MSPGLTKLIDKVRVSTRFETPETDIHIVENAYCIGCADTGSLKCVD